MLIRDVKVNDFKGIDQEYLDDESYASLDAILVFGSINNNHKQESFQKVVIAA
jgi:hypothetical protein